MTESISLNREKTRGHRPRLQQKDIATTVPLPMYNGPPMRFVLGAVAASCFVAVAILLLSWTTYFAELNSTAYDFALRLAGPVSSSSPTVSVAIDDECL